MFSFIIAWVSTFRREPHVLLSFRACVRELLVFFSM